jgi:hypothetical protein
VRILCVRKTGLFATFLTLALIALLVPPTSGSDDRPNPTGTAKSSANTKTELGSDQGQKSALVMDARSLGVTLAWVVGLTLLVSLIDIASRSKANLRSSSSGSPFLLYFGILGTGNCVAGILSFIVVQLPASLFLAGNFLHAFFGVFAFQGILSNTNITFLDKGVLTIDAWIGKARDTAVAAAIAEDALQQQQLRNKIALTLTQMDEGELDVFMDNHLGKDVFEAITAAAIKHGTNAKLYKGLEFATRKPDAASALAKGLVKK